MPTPDTHVLAAFLEVPQMSKSVSVVIPNFNGRQLLEKYLPSVIEALKHPAVSAFEIIVCDDCSTDDSVDFLHTVYPSITVLTSSVNRGFSPTSNRGITQAKKDTVLMLNTDMELQPDTVGVLMDALTNDRFGVTCAICNPADGSIQEGLKLREEHGCKLSYRDVTDDGIEGETMYLCGGIALIDRNKLQALGGYDERYAPFYYEDLDLSLRAKENGWTSWYTTRTHVLHQHAATIGSHFTKEQVANVFIRNRVLASWRFMPHKRIQIRCNALFHALQEKLARKTFRPYSEALRLISR